jgi:hypothetical protein
MSRRRSEHQFDLDTILGGESRKKGGAGGRMPMILAGVMGLALLAAVFNALGGGGHEEELPDLAEQLSVDHQLSELINAGGDWIGTVRPDWDAAFTPTQARSACDDLLIRLGIRQGEILTLMTSEGVTLASCEGR